MADEAEEEVDQVVASANAAASMSTSTPADQSRDHQDHQESTYIKTFLDAPTNVFERPQNLLDVQKISGRPKNALSWAWDCTIKEASRAMNVN